MMKEYCFRVADFLFGVYIPQELDIDLLLPSFTPFRFRREASDGRIFNFAVSSEEPPFVGNMTCLLEDTNDMGYVRLFRTARGYCIEIRHTADGITHHLQAGSDFSSATAFIRWEDPHAGKVFCSLLRIVYSQAILRHRAVSVHASAVYLDGMAYLFMGRSGTGKSTHSALWMKHIKGCRLLNDDNPVIRIKDDMAIVYGTPWSGKTLCYQDLSFPVAGMVRLCQAGENHFFLRKEVDAFITLLPGCSVIHQDRKLHHELCENLIWLSTHVLVGVLDCLPDREAALLCLSEINKNKIV